MENVCLIKKQNKTKRQLSKTKLNHDYIYSLYPLLFVVPHNRFRLGAWIRVWVCLCQLTSAFKLSKQELCNDST